MQRTIRSAAMLISAIFLTVGCNFKAANNEGAPPGGESSPQAKVKVTKVAAGDLKLQPVLSMRVYGYETTQLNSKINGYVQQFKVDIGDRFQKNEELAVLRAPELGDEVTRREQLLIQAAEDRKSAEANIRLAEARRDEQKERLILHESKQKRVKELVAMSATDPAKLDEANAAVKETEAAIRSAEAEIEAAVAADNAAAG